MIFWLIIAAIVAFFVIRFAVSSGIEIAERDRVEHKAFIAGLAAESIKKHEQQQQAAKEWEEVRAKIRQYGQQNQQTKQ